ncbi:MAG: hypothetical protein M3R25_01135 [Bacteroidota bacterium]|nr:hypothetical protein [Bacteroidota bacterium]
MKLLTKTSYYYLIISLFLFIVASGIFYSYISNILDEEVSEAIEMDKNTVLNFVAAHSS